MDDRKRENNKIKRSKSEGVKSVVSVYLNKRQFPNIRPKKTSKKLLWKRTLLDNRISKCNSVLYSSDPLVTEYSSLFEKFILWLREQKKHNGQNCDIEKLVGPLFCHLYFDIQNSEVSKANTFFKTHINKVDESKCDETVKNILKAINNPADVIMTNGAGILNLGDLKDKFRSNKIVAEISPESLKLLKIFVTNTCHILFLHTFQTWFDLKTCSKDVLKNLNHASRSIKSSDEHIIKENSCSSKGNLQELKNKLENAIEGVKKLSMSVCNVRILNSKNLVTCGLLKRQAGIVAFAEVNTLLIMPLKALDSLYSYDNVEHVRFNNHSRQIYSIALSPNNDIICTGSADHTICIYSLKILKLLKKLFGHLAPVYSIAISENSKYVISGSQDTTARLWSLISGKLLRVFIGHTGAVTSVHFHPNTLYAATGSTDKNVRMWCLKTSQPVRLLHAAKKEIYCVAFAPNGIYLACASDDKLVRVWDISQSKVVHELKSRESCVIHLTWTKNSKQLCGATLCGVVKIWELINCPKEKEKEKNKDHKHTDFLSRRRVHGRILHVDFTMGTWACLSVPKPGHSPLDAV
ncbi:uncharacterized protein LOC143197136 [Rhynchophorus ferrugineus]|uniref:uncharacterized protein LOC143197136 n=1 Tax=Rhynchophorus ferrugineus TaxID=354439 RepID=UPI003FCD9AB3